MTHKEHVPHILPLSVYLAVATALLTLTVVTVWVAQYDLGAMNLLVAMLVAAVKGTLVAMFFMHLKYTSRLYSIVIATAVMMLAVFVVFVMFDTMNRGGVYEIEAGLIEDQAVIYRQDQSNPVVADSIVPADSSISELDSAGTE
jgi:caa(3)-type oxidase subunit IV